MLQLLKDIDKFNIY